MKALVSCLAVLGFVATASAQHSIQGSDTLAPILTDLINEAGLESEVVYLGGGSGKGEKALLAGSQALAPMSRAFKKRDQAQAQGIQLEEKVIGLDGVGVWMNKGNSVAELTVEQIRKVFTCEITNWSDLGGATAKINAYRRDDFSGTTDTFKKLVGIKTFGNCVVMKPETTDIAFETTNDVDAIGFSGMSANTTGNKAAAIAKNAGETAYLPTTESVQKGQYPLARNLYVYVAGGTVKPNAIEEELIELLGDRSVLDPILQAHDFFLLP